MYLNFDKLFLVRDNEYGTYVTYICEYPNKIYLNFFTDKENISEIIGEIYYYINKLKKRIKL